MEQLTKKSKGFTLIELLVVLAIVAVLAGVIMVAVNPAALLQKNRDVARLDDLNNIHKALSLALADGEIALVNTDENCEDCNTAVGTQAVDGSGWVKFEVLTGKTGLARYLPELPLDPMNGAGFVYVFGSTEAGYELNVVLESEDNAAKMSTDGGNNPEVYEVGTNLTIL